MNLENPLIVQGDRTLLLDVHAPLAQECRNDLIPFAELERSPEHLHTYRLTPLSLWNSTSAGFSAQDAVDVLEKYARYDVPQSVVMWIKETATRFGKLRLLPGPCIEVPLKTSDVLDIEPTASKIEPKTVKEQYLYLTANSRPVFLEIASNPQVKKILEQCELDESFLPEGTTVTEEEKKILLPAEAYRPRNN